MSCFNTPHEVMDMGIKSLTLIVCLFIEMVILQLYGVYSRGLMDID